jgi:predicted GNAT family N-acyltransferase
MVIEYNYRVHQERRRDMQDAQALAEEAINEVINQASDKEVNIKADAHDEPA